MKQVAISLSSLFSGIILLCTLIFITNDQIKTFNSWNESKGIFWSSAIQLNIMQLYYFSFILIILNSPFSTLSFTTSYIMYPIPKSFFIEPAIISLV